MSNTWGIKRSDRGFLKVGSTSALVIPVQSGARNTWPPKFQMAAGVSNNVFDVSYWDGLYFPSLNAPVDVTDDWFTATNLNAWFVTRGAAVGVGFDDIAEMPTVAYSDGNVIQTLAQAKGNVLTMGCRQNEQLRCSLGIMGVSATTTAWTLAGAPTPNILTRASFADVEFTAGIAGVTDWTFSIANNLAPNPIMGAGAGTAVVELNAGKPVVVLQATVDAAGTFPTNEGSYTFTVKPPGAATAVTITCARYRLDDPDNIGRSGDRAQQTFTLTNMSSDGVVYPLVVS